MRGLAQSASIIKPASGARLLNKLSRALTIEAGVCAVAAVLLLWLVLYPLLILLLGSVRTDLPMRPGTLTLANFTNLLASPENLAAILNTIVSSALATLLALAIGISLAWVTSRTDTPARRFFDNAFVIPFYLSPFIGAIAWTLLANPRVGFINNLLVEVLGFEDAPINIYGLAGMVLVMALYYAPIVFLFVAGSLRVMDPALEEASRIHGAGALATARRVTLPLMAPAVASSALLVFLNAAGQFGIPAVIGIPADYHVITTRIWVDLGYFPPKYAEAAAFAVVMLAFSSIILLAQRRMLARRSYAVVTGKGYRPAVVKLGPMRFATLTLCILYFLASIVLPYSALILTSFEPYLSFAFEPGSWTLHNYAEVLLNNPLTVRATANSLFLGGAGAILARDQLHRAAYPHSGAPPARLPRDRAGGRPRRGVRGGVAMGLHLPAGADLRHDLDAAHRLYRPLHSLRRPRRDFGSRADRRRAGGECPHPWRDLDRHDAKNRRSPAPAGARRGLDSPVRRVHPFAQSFHPALHAAERGDAGRYL